MGLKKITKQSTTPRGSKILSTTLLLLCVFGLLIFTFTEDSSSYDYGKKGMNDLASDLFEDNENTKLTNNKVPSNMKEEIELNSLRVEEQISTIRGELSNIAPTHINTNIRAPTITPGLGLNFDAERNFKEIINTSPVVIFIKSSDPASHYLKNLLLREYEVSPEMAVVDLDRHVQGQLLQKYIKAYQLTSGENGNPPEVPYLFINGVSVINNGIEKDIKQAQTKGILLDKLKSFASDNVMIQKKDMPSNS
ncbi:hypothetical protein Kpol_1072p14 [Vanderwaltozyma polyspora DSM 70294]|uniref:Uncharacterized protein n=1 Tax=Vanderwaltozyma polyspora (strain ATCC 22028 / DSM 70294 / BCRC 21397 / CBS 2163 / NBRC 10782 / NRRL Y-8283 / UCD 57-17) TaxID=436907 RepID=A7TKN2_VANPO|nr:uncharacterized protein Kpol_1072p14 [Vanderwaltozyma polyspora DSM 70294]EDO17144.1 hypothetical protein Kpol_1072p14 [Vanderwaltozyma polyspora DSM 70294]